MTPSSRRMRRSREVAPSNDEPLSGFELYEVKGDSSTALEVFSVSEGGASSGGGGAPSTAGGSVDADGRSAVKDAAQRPATLASKYNCLLLSHVVPQKQGGGSRRSNASLLKQMEVFEAELEAKNREQMLTARKRKRNELILAYNRALVLHSSGMSSECMELCSEKVGDMIESRQKPAEELLIVSTRMAFLILECILGVSVASKGGLEFRDPRISEIGRIIAWLEFLESDKDPQLKFLLRMYKSRLDLAELDDSGKHADSKIRSARKELKSAMEVFQHKLRSAYGADTGSVVSSANSEENASTYMPHEQHQHQQQQKPSSVVLQKHNQSALNLKANLEQLKGNTKKSLILCSEALGSAASDSTYDAIHNSNLAIVYESNNKRHLALHALAKGLQAHAVTSTFHEDGTARPNQTLMVLYNSSVCALQAGNYISAYECMAACVSRSETFRCRPRCWLRMAEACLGVFSGLQPEKNNAFCPVEANSEPVGLVLDHALCTDSSDLPTEKLVSVLASREDLEQVKRNPLLRARACLEQVLSVEDGLGPDALLSVSLTMAFVSLSFRDYRKALALAKVVLNAPALKSDVDELTKRVQKRRTATARMYAAEASCALGENVEAMKFLVGDGQDDAFDRLGSDLAGVTLETAATNGKGKRRLARAQTMVRSSASAASTAIGNLPAAKKLAMSAQAMEDAYTSNREQSSARKALIYCLLRGGNHAAALTLLRAMRIN